MATIATQRSSVALLAALLAACGDTDPGEGLTPPDTGLTLDVGMSTKGDVGIEPDGGMEDVGPEIPAHCENGVRDEVLGETAIDCGGDCAGCAFGQSCGSTADCGFGLACGNDGICDLASCEDGVRGEDETDVDCGGPECHTRCVVQQRCDVTSDCSGLRCVDGRCAPASCEDALLNGEESDVDCGGPDCGPCGVGSACLVRTDCPEDVYEETLCSSADLCTETGTQAYHRETYGCSNGACTVEVEDRDNVSCARETEGRSCGAPFESAWTACGYAQECGNLGERTREVERSMCRSGLCETLAMTETSTCGARNTDNNLCGGTLEWPQVTCERNASSNPCSRAGTATRDTHRCVRESCILVEERATQSCTFDPAGRTCASTCRYKENTCTDRRSTGMRAGRRTYYTREIWRRPRVCDSAGSCIPNGNETFAGRRESLQYYQGSRYDCSRSYGTTCP